MTQIKLRLDISSLQKEVIELLEKTSKQMTLVVHWVKRKRNSTKTHH